MSDPVGLVGNASNLPPDPRRPSGPAGEAQGFRDALFGELHKAAQMQQDADRAIEDLQTGQRTDLEGVLLATQKADTAFRLLQQMRNKVMEAYQEIQQLRV